jgi:transcription elongation factor GreA-like protein
MQWARRHGASFAFEKYILVHFTNAQAKHNTSFPMILSCYTTYSSPSARVLRVILDKEFNW